MVPPQLLLTCQHIILRPGGAQMDTECFQMEAHLHCVDIFVVITKHHQNKLKYFYAGAFNSNKFPKRWVPLQKSYEPCFLHLYYNKELVPCLPLGIRCYQCGIFLLCPMACPCPPANPSALICTLGHLPSVSKRPSPPWPLGFPTCSGRLPLTSR